MKTINDEDISEKKTNKKVMDSLKKIDNNF